MNLQDKTLEERKKLTRAFPVVIVGKPGCGKSAAIEFLPAEEKMRTIILDVEAKGLPEDDEADYYKVIKLKSIDSDNDLKDHGNVMYKTIEELLPYFKKAMASDKIDRIVVDTFTAFVSELERHYVTVHNGFTVWNSYNQQLHDFFRMLKEETYTHGKFVYVLGHYKPSKDKKDQDAEKFMVVKGNAHYRLIESHFNTVVEVDEFKFRADNSDEYDSTRIKRSLSPYESKENSMAELESALNK
jgi:hypothetical protein